MSSSSCFSRTMKEVQIMRYPMRSRWCWGLFGTLLAATGVFAQSCPDGNYRGDRGDGRSYIKDNYVWAVTADFARRFCMPKEFIVSDLEGAEAVAYWYKPVDFELCETKSGRTECRQPGGKHWIELYVKHGSIPKADASVGYYVDHYPTGADMISHAQSGRNADRRRQGRYTDPGGHRRPFMPPESPGRTTGTRFHLLAREAPDVHTVRPAALLEKYFYEHWVDGIDQIALEGWANGSIAGVRYPVTPRIGYAIATSKEHPNAGLLKYPEGFLHVIALPKRITESVEKVDREHDFVRSLQEIFNKK